MISLYQDSRGYLWIGTNEGLTRYDGVNFRHYGITEGLPNSHVWCISGSRRSPDTIYIGTHGGGLTRLAGERFQSVPLGTALAANVVADVVEDADGVVWCRTNRGVYRVRGDGAEGFHPQAYHPEGDSRAAGFLAAMGDTAVWTGIGRNVYIYSLPGARTRRIGFELSEPHSLNSVAFDEKGNAWIGATDGRIFHLREGRVIASRRLDFIPPSDPRMVLACDRQGTLWIGASSGLAAIEAERFASGKITRYTTDNGLPDHQIACLLQDRENNLWFGSYAQGMVKLAYRNISIFPFKELNPTVMNRAATAREDRFYLVCNEGLAEIWGDPSGGWNQFLHTLDRGPFQGRALAADFDRQGRLWVAFENGGFCGYAVHTPREGKSRLALLKILAPGIDFADGCSISNSGVAQLNLERFEQEAFYSEADGLAGLSIRAISRDGEGRVWFGDFVKGISVHRWENDKLAFEGKFTTAEGLPDNGIRALLGAASGEVWIGTRFGGIAIYRNGAFETISTREGLPSNAVWGFAEDRDGRIWVGTSLGMLSLEGPGRRKPHIYKPLGERVIGSVGVSQSGMAWGVANNEFLLYDTRQAPAQTMPPSIYITGLRVNGKDIPEEHSLRFQYDENFIAIMFTGISLRDEKALRYHYRLAGLDGHWSPPVSERLVTYAALRPGTYTFEVYALNGESVRSAEAASLAFTIVPPLWQRRWFIILCFGLVAGTIIGLERLRVRRLLQIERIRARIATDLHDDIGSGLTHIGLLSEVAVRKFQAQRRREREEKSASTAAEKPGDTASTPGTGSAELVQAVERVGEISRELSAAMSDVVWSINPRYDSVEALLRRLSTYAGEICRAKNIDLVFDIPESIVKTRLNPETRRSLLLIAKEALNNMAKYSHSPSAKLDFQIDGNEIHLTIEDSGAGFDVSREGSGNGLPNMRSRAEKLGGRCEIVSAPGKGTRVRVMIPLKGGRR